MNAFNESTRCSHLNTVYHCTSTAELQKPHNLIGVTKWQARLLSLPLATCAIASNISSTVRLAELFAGTIFFCRFP